MTWLVYTNPTRHRALLHVRPRRADGTWAGPFMLATSFDSAVALVPTGASVQIWVPPLGPRREQAA